MPSKKQGRELLPKRSRSLEQGWDVGWRWARVCTPVRGHHCAGAGEWPKKGSELFHILAAHKALPGRAEMIVCLKVDKAFCPFPSVVL